MTAITNNQHLWTPSTVTRTATPNLWQKWLIVADSQAPNKTEWFAASLVIMGVLFLPLPAVLIYNYNAPIIVLVISMILFFGNFIAGMGGSNIRVTLTLFALSVLTYITMAAIIIL